ncbi:MAG: VOC family protein [Actinobacteria bacterium]|nr:VOC family protein [Actinomycetota bacterium]
MPIDAVPDHVAVAVPDFDVADRRWRDELGGRWVAWYHARGAFRSRQSRFRGGAKLELLMPSDADPSPDGFLRRYLDRFGAGVHHVTLKVPDLHEAIATLEDAGYDVVDVDDSGADWKESFLRPSQVGGIIVQVAWSARSDAEWAASHGYVPEEPPADGAVLRGPLLEHPDLELAAEVWATLGADVEPDGDGVVASWDGAPLEVRIRPGRAARPVGLVFEGAEARPGDPELGAAVIPHT